MENKRSARGYLDQDEIWQRNRRSGTGCQRRVRGVDSPENGTPRSKQKAAAIPRCKPAQNGGVKTMFLQQDAR